MRARTGGVEFENSVGNLGTTVVLTVNRHPESTGFDGVLALKVGQGGPSQV